MRGVVYLITGGAPVGDEGLPAAFIAFGTARFLGIHYLVWVPAVLLLVLSWVMQATPYGRRVYATGGNREAAYLSWGTGRADHRIDLCVVRGAGWRGRSNAGGTSPVRVSRPPASSTN